MSASTLFLTGGNGFIGRHVVARLEQSGFDEVIALTRRVPADAAGKVRWIHGDLMDPDTYREMLGPRTTVLHLAAATGNAPAAEHRRVNTMGTERLLAACRQRQVCRFAFVSTVAVRYGEVRDYPYALSKRAAEAAVERSGIPFLIVRPTIVLGRESPIWKRFRQLAGSRYVAVIGSGATRVQPIHVDDLAQTLVELARSEVVDRTLEVGGPEALTLRDLFGRIHKVLRGTAPRYLQIPYAPTRALLAFLERLPGNPLPVSAAQLALFVNDGTVRPTEPVKQMMPRMMKVEPMLLSLERGDG